MRDETTAPVLDPGRGRTKTGYLRAMLRDDRSWGGADPPAVAFRYAPGRSGEHADRMPAGFEGILHVDGCAGYDRLADDRREGGTPLRLAYCRAHARREIVRAAPKAGSPVADDLLGRIAELHEIEATIRGAPADIRLAERQARSKPILGILRAALDLHASRLSRKSKMGKALAYVLARWAGLTRFTEDGRIEMGTNPVENAIRPLASAARTHSSRATTRAAAPGRTWARLASLVGTCRLDGVEPFACLAATLEAIARGHPAADIDALMHRAFAATPTKSAAWTAVQAANDPPPPPINPSSQGKGMGPERRLRITTPVHKGSEIFRICRRSFNEDPSGGTGGRSCAASVRYSSLNEPK